MGNSFGLICKAKSGLFGLPGAYGEAPVFIYVLNSICGNGVKKANNASSPFCELVVRPWITRCKARADWDNLLEMLSNFVRWASLGSRFPKRKKATEDLRLSLGLNAYAAMRIGEISE
ncbi:hypothetical protein [Pseudovibrio brasiliensis]|uniref:Uncharacterized protein n=1 Tax=Pseudovibrio brasiliensis TaxID=1898042 RepID=A0ABX8AKZ2_9HYPH|nr:hypothetical protein [Pseudovibrio brasiliensis]QUS54565.1 hypothetical protein KGB56_14320 [Pseudovibrio brasiliensis]